MRHAANQKAQIVIRTLPAGNLCTVTVSQDSLEHFGWLEHYETIQDYMAAKHGTRAFAYTRISGSRSRKAKLRSAAVVTLLPPGSGQKTKTRSFGISCKTTQFDLAELAYFLKCDWHFLIGPDGIRRPRAWWLALYQRGAHGNSALAA